MFQSPFIVSTDHGLADFIGVGVRISRFLTVSNDDKLGIDFFAYLFSHHLQLAVRILGFQ